MDSRCTRKGENESPARRGTALNSGEGVRICKSPRAGSCHLNTSVESPSPDLPVRERKRAAPMKDLRNNGHMVYQPTYPEGSNGRTQKAEPFNADLGPRRDKRLTRHLPRVSTLFPLGAQPMHWHRKQRPLVVGPISRKPEESPASYPTLFHSHLWWKTNSPCLETPIKIAGSPDLL